MSVERVQWRESAGFALILPRSHAPALRWPGQCWQHWEPTMGFFTRVASKLPPVVRDGAKKAQHGKSDYAVKAFAQKGRDSRDSSKKK
jgi:hypothetical protein